MSNPRLPTKLNKEPLVDALFELRFSSSMPGVDVLPGALFSAFHSQQEGMKVERLPLSQLPDAIRMSDPNLRYGAMVRMEWDEFFILVGHSSMAVACKIPYPGWAKFKPGIMKVLSTVKDFGVIESVERYSLKYVDLIPEETIKNQISALDWDIRIGSNRAESSMTSLRMEVEKDDMLHIITVQTGAVVTTMASVTSSGVIVDIDTIRMMDNVNFNGFMSSIEHDLELTHDANKEMFFDCLRESTITALEPTYDKQ